MFNHLDLCQIGVELAIGMTCTALCTKKKKTSKTSRRFGAHDLRIPSTFQFHTQPYRIFIFNLQQTQTTTSCPRKKKNRRRTQCDPGDLDVYIEGQGKYSNFRIQVDFSWHWRALKGTEGHELMRIVRSGDACFYFCLTGGVDIPQP